LEIIWQFDFQIIIIITDTIALILVLLANTLGCTVYLFLGDLVDLAYALAGLINNAIT